MVSGKDKKSPELPGDDPDYWTNFQKQTPEIDELINEFNDKVGLI